MKLFLTSAGLPPETTEAFLKLLNKKPEEVRVCFIPTASFVHHPEGDAPYMKEDKNRLIELGFKSIMDIDLRNENEESLKKKLKSFEAIFVTGGNTFYLLKYVRESGLDKVLKEFLDRGGVYIGVSAGTIIAGKNISISDWKSDWDENVVGMDDFQGLGLVDFVISPHYVLKHDEVINENKYRVSCPIYALTDLQAISVNDDKIELVGFGEFKIFNKKITDQQLSNWLHFSLGYLKAAEICADAFINYVKDEKNIKSGFKAYGKFCFIPAIWNLKHSFELTIKFLSKRLDSRARKTHDLPYLLQEFKVEAGLSDQEIKELSNMYNKYVNFESFKNLPQPQMNLDTGKLFQLPNDEQNMFFHYPEEHLVHNGYEKFFYYSLAINANEAYMVSVLEELKVDTEKFARIFLILFSLK